MKKNKLEELIKKLCPNGVKYKKLEDCCNILDNERKPVTKSARIKGEYPYYGANGIQDYVSDYIFDGTFILVGEDGSVINKNGNPVVTWAKGKIWVNNHAHVIKEKENVLLRYLYHYIQTINVSLLIHGNIPKLNQGDFRNLRIAVPPLEVQCEIVHILDNFTLLSAELSAELKARQKQYEYYKDELYSFKNKNVEYVKLKDIAEVIRGGNFQKKDFIEKGKPCIHYGQIYTRYGSSACNTFTFVNKEIFDKSRQAQTNDIIMAVTSENVEDVCKCVVWCGNENVAVSGHTAIIHHNINAKYLGYYFSTSHFYKDKTKLVHGTKVMEVTPSSLNEIRIPLPDLEEQEQIANLIESFDKLCNDISAGLPAEIEARRKQYEYYREKLLTFKELK